MIMRLLAAAVGSPTGYGVGALGNTVGSGYSFGDTPSGQRITTTQDWQTRINTIGAGSAGSPKLIGIEAGTHSGSNVQNVQPLAYQYFIGETDGVPTAQYPNGTPTTIVDGGQTVTSPGTTYFMRPGGTNVTVENLEVTGFNAAGYENNLMTINDNTGTDWLIFNCYIHDCYDGVKASTNMRLEHCVIERMSRHWLLSSGYPGYLYGPQNLGGWRVQNCRISEANSLQSDWQVTGTMKVGGGQENKVFIQACEFDDCYGPAIWFDASSQMGEGDYDIALISHNRFVDNGISLFYEIMGALAYPVDGATGLHWGTSNQVGLTFDSNWVQITGQLFGEAPGTNNPQRLIKINNSRASQTYPIRITNNTLKHAGPMYNFGPMIDLFQDTTRPAGCQMDWVVIRGNDMEFSGSASDSTWDKQPSFIAGAQTDWAGVCSEGEIWDYNFLIDGNTYRWVPSDGSTGPFVWDGNTHYTWTQWKGFGFDTTGSTYTEV